MMLRKEFQEKALKEVLFPAVSEWIASYGTAIINTSPETSFMLSMKIHGSLKENRPCSMIMNVQDKKLAANYARDLLIAEMTSLSGEELDRLLTIAVRMRNALESEEGKEFVEGIITHGAYETKNLKGYIEVISDDTDIINLILSS